MTMHPSETDLNDYVDGALPDVERARVAEHLQTCAACRRTVDDLERITEAARSLAPITPPDAAWHRIRREASAAGSPPSAARAASGPPEGGPYGWRTWLAAAAVLILAVGGWYAVAHRGQPPQPAPTATAPAPAADAQMVAAEFQQASEHYQKAITGLEQITRSDAKVLDPQTAAAVQKGLSTIDQAIDESSAALKQQPASEPAQQSLLENFRTKLSFLEDTVALINEMRKGNEAGAARIVSGLKQNNKG